MSPLPAQARFPAPEFTGGYAPPPMGLEGRSFDAAEWRVVLTVLALAFAAWALHRLRSRTALTGLAFRHAVRGRVEWPAVALFAILFVWQFPHFMAIAWLYREDYGRAGIRMLPVVQPDGLSTVVEALFYAAVMIPVSLTPWWLGLDGPVYAALAAVLGIVYLAYTIRFGGILRQPRETESRMLARDLLKVSVIYLPVLLTALMLCATGKR